MRRCLVLCRDINEKRYNIDCYRAPDGKYYSSQEAYNDIVSKRNKLNEDRNKCIDIVAKALNYDNGMPMPTFAYKKIEELSSYGYDVIEETINNKLSDINWAISHKIFKTEVNKIQYVFAIIQNNCKETLDKKRREEKMKEKEASSKPVYNIDCVGTNKKGNDISSLLGDDDWI